MNLYASTTFWTAAAAVFIAVMAGFTGWSIVASPFGRANLAISRTATLRSAALHCSAS